ncbi:glycosyl hydrolase family 28-related protein [Paenibacillus sp. 1P03SA]|uniref:glycosyl hydrolase family 28-related protein n=1 Tax=Paenibacillus sp. 1P03SA TaxID=3132294 RepID=UPI0039A1E839
MAQVSELKAEQYVNAAVNRKVWDAVMYNVATEGIYPGKDVTQKLQALINKAIAEDRKAIFFPHGQYYVTSLVNADKVSFIGDNASFIGGYTGVIQQLGDYSKDYLRRNELFFNVRDFGAVGDGIADDSTAIQNCVNAAYAHSGSVYFPGGVYKITKTILFDQTSLVDSNDRRRPNIKGEGSAQTRIVFLGLSGPAFHIKGGTSGEGHHSYQNVSGFFLVGNNVAGTTGMYSQNTAFLHSQDIRISGFDYGIYCDDIEHSRFENVSLRFNQKGIFARQNPAFYPVSTYPNNISFASCHIGSNAEYGGWFIGPTTVNFSGGSIEANGITGTTGVNHGLRFEDSGYQGGVGCILTGVYFEQNKGIADVFIFTSTSAINPLNSCTYLIQGCSFSRISSTNFVSHNIWAHFAANGGQQMLNVIGCGFKRFNGYTADASRTYIYFDGLPMSSSNRFFAGNMFMDAVEAVPQLTQP